MINKSVVKSPDEPKASNNRLTWSILAVLLSFIIFLPSLNYPFIHYDDFDYLVENDWVKNFDWKSMFTDRRGNLYTPLVFFTYAIEYYLFKLNPFVYHFDNIILHTGNTLLTYTFLKKLKTIDQNWISFITLLFAVHPIHTESVVWITERKDLLYSFFFLLSLNSWLNFSQGQNKNQYLLALVFYILSCFSKVMAISLPLWIFAIDRYFVHTGKPLKVLLKQLAPFVIISGLFALIALQFMGKGTLPPWVRNYSVFDKAFIFIYSIGYYPIKTFLPVDLSLIHPYPNYLKGESNSFWFYAGLFTTSVLFFLFIQGNKQTKAVLGIYFAGILPVLQIVPNTFSPVADRYAYLPMIGVLLLLPLQLQKIKINTGILLFVSFIFGVLCFQQTTLWKNEDVLFSDVIKKYPYCDRAYNQRGIYLFTKKEYQKAETDFLMAVELNPELYHALSNLGMLYASKGNVVEGKNYLKQSLILNPFQAEALNNLAGIAVQEKNYKDAIDYLKRAIDLKPENQNLYTNLAFCYLNNGDSTNYQFYKNFRKTNR